MATTADEPKVHKLAQALADALPATHVLKPLYELVDELLAEAEKVAAQAEAGSATPCQQAVGYERAFLAGRLRGMASNIEQSIAALVRQQEMTR